MAEFFNYLYPIITVCKNLQIGGKTVAEPISTSTPQMSYMVKRVNENSQNIMKGQRRGNNYNK